MNRLELDPHSSPRAAFGAQLRTSREENGWTQDELGERLEYSGTHVSAVETGRKPPTLRLARRADVVFGTGTLFLDMFRDIRRTSLLEGFPDYVAHEARAVEIRLFELGIIPGLLQTPEYAAAVTMGAVRRGNITQEQADERLTFIAERQARLVRHPAPLIHAVLDESCIRRPVGGPAVMAAQLDQLIAFAELPHTVLQVAPYDIEERRSFDLPVNILTLPDRSLVAYAESALQGHLERGSDAVVPVLTAYHQLQAEALSQTASVAVIQQVRKELQ
ncbi:transcriptional regulator with XRE-family HTH domain [Kitasatospora sp. GAS204A]|uniref:helix-turn-helix domain-containing protein n=1 Tax=unclassified Kitasatospora TaxID=2633591 RepID=UPI0024761526|nr:helix-turn-helix transcriptional regulator [Kitasatospora sp. GAS204B]MDH6118453.1 transcriptional regulator with XRE-family HTH domain [Kitasatospora sp. GAS204B]